MGLWERVDYLFAPLYIRKALVFKWRVCLSALLPAAHLEFQVHDGSKWPELYACLILIVD